jgi:hypothetical protein
MIHDTRAPPCGAKFLPQKCWTKRLQDNLSRQDAKLRIFSEFSELGVFASLHESSLFRFRNVNSTENFKHVWLDIYSRLGYARFATVGGRARFDAHPIYEFTLERNCNE